MKTEKMFDCVFVTVDDKNRRTVRYANDMTNRLLVFKRANFQVLFQLQADKQMTKLELCDLALNDTTLDVNDEDLFEKEKLRLTKKSVTTTDVLEAIRQRHIDSQQQNNLVVA